MRELRPSVSFVFGEKEFVKRVTLANKYLHVVPVGEDLPTRKVLRNGLDLQINPRCVASDNFLASPCLDRRQEIGDKNHTCRT